MNKGELIDALAEKTDLTKVECGRILDALFSEDGILIEALKRSESVQIVGFGTFEAKYRNERTGRNPQTGESITIPGAWRPVFRPGKNLKDAVAEEAVEEAAAEEGFDPGPMMSK